MTKPNRFDFNLRVGEDEHKGLIFDNGQVMKTINVAYLLNKLSEENEQLKSEIKDYQDTLARMEERLQIKDYSLKKQLEVTANQQKRIKELEESEQKRKEYDEFWAEKIKRSNGSNGRL